MNCIVCDIQPMYEKYIPFDIKKFTRYLNNQNNILYFYVGVEDSGIGEDSESDLKIWLLENGLKESTLYRTHFIEKGYGFLRGYMDNYINDNNIINIIKHMVNNNINDSRDISEGIDIPNIDDNIYLPNFNYNDIKFYNNSKLVGGGKNECLKELELYFKALDFKYKLNNNYIYGN